MATSSIFADFTIKTNKQAEAFFKAVDQSKKHPRPKRKCRIRQITSKKELDALFKKLNEKYG